MVEHVYVGFKEAVSYNPAYRGGGFLKGVSNFLPSFCGGTKILRAIFMGYKTILLEKFWIWSLIKD